MTENSEDYHVNAQFKIGGINSEGRDRKEESSHVKTHRVDSHGTIPSVVAKATPRMMGSRSTSSNNHSSHQHSHSSNQQPLMPPVDLHTNSSNNSAENQGRTNPNTPQTQQQSKMRNITKATNDVKQQPKQFHRKSIGDWDFLETVGAGSMGKVKLAKHRKTREVCAIKIVNRATKAFLHKEHSMPAPNNDQEIMQRQKALEKEISRDKRTIREASLGQILYHPHICRLFEMCTMSNHFYMLFEYVSGGQLLDYIIQHGSLKEHLARKFARGIASALQYLHANNIVHRDLKIENIMISTSGEIKIIDFGLSNLYDPKEQLFTFCGSLYFAAPELLKAHPYTGPEVDVWSFGVVLYVLVCGKVPFDDENSSVLHEKIKQGKVDYPAHLSIEVISLLSKMLVVEPKKRASLNQVVDHPWMTRGYEGAAPSYVPQRVPITPESINPVVMKELFRLEFIDDIEEGTAKLQGVVSEREYVQLAQEYWRLKEANSNTSAKFTDPTTAYHPLISLYYLVEEMLKNKLKKMQRKQQMLQQQQKQQLASQQQLQLQQQQSQKVSLQQSLSKDSVKNATIGESPKSPQGLKTPLPPAASNTTVKKVNSQDSGKSISKQLHIMIPPKLVVPEQAHTSPNSRKSPERQHEDLDFVLSPGNNQYTDYNQRTEPLQTLTPADSEERSSFGSIFRKLSQRRNNQPTNEPEVRKPVQKTHLRAYSEHVPSNGNVPVFPNNNAYNKQPIPTMANISPNISPKRSASQKQPITLPALPINAENLLQEQRAKQGTPPAQNEKLIVNKVRGNAGKPIQQMSDDEDRDSTRPLPPLNPTGSHKLHPSARAKSVGHARRESLKFIRPPVSTSGNQPEAATAGFLDGVSRGEYGLSVATSNSTYHNAQNTEMEHSQKVASTGYDVELTDQEILDEASKAPPGSMPSIDYPRSLFLKGFFSVQTTSSKPLPIVRYKIISVLKKMNIEFSEVKGGFVCVQYFNEEHHAYQESAPPQFTVTDDEQTFTSPLSPQQILQPPAATHRRVMSGTPQLNVRRQSSVKHNQPGIPATPLGINPEEGERNPSFTFIGSSSIHSNNAPNGIISEEYSSASLDYLHQDDILTTSKVQDMNKMGGNHSRNSSLAYQMAKQQQTQQQQQPTSGENETSKDRPPIRFEIHIVKVRIVGLAGVHFKKVSGNTWIYKELASTILSELSL